MFTVLWKIPGGAEEIYASPGIAKIARAEQPSEQMDCHGKEHVAFQRLDGYDMTRTLIDIGEVFVMNAEGKTVATYRF